MQVSNDGMVLCKKSLDDLLKVVEQNNHMEIRAAVEPFLWRNESERPAWGIHDA